MKKYTINWSYLESGYIDIEAENPEEAKEKVLTMDYADLVNDSSFSDDEGLQVMSIDELKE